MDVSKNDQKYYKSRLVESTLKKEEMEMLSSLKKEELLKLLSDGFCHHCEDLIHARITCLRKRKLDEDLESFGEEAVVNRKTTNSNSLTKPLEKQWNNNPLQKHNGDDSTLSMRLRDNNNNNNNNNKDTLDSELLLLNDGIGGVSSSFENGLSEKQKELIKYSQVKCKKDFTFLERVNGRPMNVLKGLELHTGVFNIAEQNKIIEYIYRLQWIGKQGKLKDRTYSEPRKWMRGKGRATIQFGCGYNYAVDKNGNPPGILRNEEVDPLPAMFKQMIKRMVRWNIIPSTCVPDSCIVNIYDVGDCIPPHIDHHDFVRPFYTVSFLSESDILFGSNLKVISPGEFWGPASISLPVGSVFVFNGNGADVAKHCIPSVSSKRISITFRKMDERKLPYKFTPDPELVGIKPLNITSTLNKRHKAQSPESESNTVWNSRKEEMFRVKDEYPPPINGSYRNLEANKFGHRARH